MFAFRSLVVLILSLAIVPSLNAAGVFIPAADRVDMVHDGQRGLIYISNGPRILRYDLAQAQFLSAFDLGGSLSGIDLSPDGNVLAVADRDYGSSENWIHLVNLETGNVEKVSFPKERSEAGTWTLAYGRDGRLLISSMYAGSGWVPLRRYDPVSETHTQLARVRQNSMLTASGDASVIAYVENSISSGPVGRYWVDEQILEPGAATGWFNFEIGVDSSGSQYSVPTYGGTYVYDENWLNQGILGDYAGSLPIGLVYHPVEDLVYHAWSGTTEVREYDALSLMQTAAYDFEHSFSWVGNHAFQQGRLKISRDGSLLMATVAGGVRYHQLYAPLQAGDSIVTTDENTAVDVLLEGSIGNNRTLSYSVTQPPAQGQLLGEGQSLTYVPGENFSGTDTFHYSVSYGRAKAGGAVDINVVDTNQAPAAEDDSALIPNRFVAIPVLMNDRDPDGDPLSIASFTQPAYGAVTLSEDGSTLEYRALKRKRDLDFFTYTISDGNGEVATAQVTVYR